MDEFCTALVSTAPTILWPALSPPCRTIGDIDVWNGDRGLADPARYGTSDGRTVTIRAAAVLDSRSSDVGTSLANASVAWAGIVRGITDAGNQRVRLSVVDIAERLVTPVQTTRYRGTGGMDGGPGAAGIAEATQIGRYPGIAAGGELAMHPLDVEAPAPTVLVVRVEV